MKYRKAPTGDEIEGAIKAAEQGKGRKLASLVKSFSEEDLASAFGTLGQQGMGFSALGRALNFAAGRKEFREKTTAELRAWRKDRREAR